MYNIHFYNIQYQSFYIQSKKDTQSFAFVGLLLSLDGRAARHSFEQLCHKVWVSFKLVHLVNELSAVLNHELYNSFLQLFSIVKISKDETLQASVYVQGQTEHLLADFL